MIIFLLTLLPVLVKFDTSLAEILFESYSSQFISKKKLAEQNNIMQVMIKKLLRFEFDSSDPIYPINNSKNGVEKI